ncbi:hypothetical protein CISIN_1g035319mg [Citrus sinensis]|uniref:Uncharacterized protein n=1 Tax=Citrus sinensis TaxID=2711 RepID=A0A067DDD5_CITSI|nr:hypothetical protein CISIN_1g035319mg [Citrus sinensis]
MNSSSIHHRQFIIKSSNNLYHPQHQFKSSRVTTKLCHCSSFIVINQGIGRYLSSSWMLDLGHCLSLS